MSGVQMRSLPAPPRDQPPNDTPPVDSPVPTTANPPGDYNPVGVGPNSSEGFGNTHVADLGAPFGPTAWSGWPDAWATPEWNAGFVGAWGRRVDVVFACLDLNASIVSTMPPYIVRGIEPQEDRPYLVNPEPEVYVSWDDFMKSVVWCYQSVGEVFIYATARYADGYPSRFMMLNPSLVAVDQIGGRLEYRVAGVPVDPDDVLHVKYLSWPGDLHGHGPLEAAGARLLQVSALTKYATNLTESGGLPPAVLKYPRRASRGQMRQMQRDWVEARMSSMGLPAVLADGTDLEVLNPQLRDSALSDLSKFSEARIATLLGVPPFLLGLPSADAGTYVNSTNVFDFHWRASLRPKAHALTAALSGWLLPRGWALELNRDEYTRPGMFERAQAYSMLVGAGILSAQEVRTFERYAGAAPGATTGTTVPDAPVPAEPTDAPAPSAEPDFTAPGRPASTNTNPEG